MFDFVDIESIDAVFETSDVYDITVDDTHNFFADDILVHNCIGGPIAFAVFHEFKNLPQDQLTAALLDDPDTMDRAVRRVGNVIDELVDALGKENVYPEIQFNKLPSQHLVNRAIMEFARRNGMKLVATADSHYCRPEFWKAREMYKKLGWLGYENITPESLPRGIEDLKCELYPKNADQMWTAFKEYCADYQWYDANMVRDAIENTWYLAHDVIGNIEPDTSMKLASYPTNMGQTPFQALVNAVKEGLIRKGLDKKPEYIARAKRELDVIKTKSFELYFLTMKVIFEVASNVVLTGAGRGSAGGSLVNYLLGITQIDPIKHDLLFERFLTVQRCLAEGTEIVMSDGTLRQIEQIKIGDLVKSESDNRKVLNVERTEHDIVYEIDINGKTITCSPEHKWPIIRNGSRILVTTDEIKSDDMLLMTDI